MYSFSIRRLSLPLLVGLILAGCGSGNSDNEPKLRSGPDPLWPLQWHLLNNGQSGGQLGVDVNVQPVWESCTDASCRGEQVLVAVVDDGLEIRHPDLWPNIKAGASYNFLNESTDPTPRSPSRSHGTAVAGLLAARDLNAEGGRGVAPRAQLAGYNLLESPSASNRAKAMFPKTAAIWVSTNSWGPVDKTGTMQPSDWAWREAIRTGLDEGRNGLGIIYTWAAGNGHEDRIKLGQSFQLDNSNYDGYANHYGVIAVGAIDHNGQRASYSEKGANLWLVAPGGAASCGPGTLVTTDLSGAAGLNDGNDSQDLVGMPDYSRCMNGTSAATPLVAGVVALMLQANPQLSWRDVRIILARTARKNHPEDSDWTDNHGDYRYHINHNYGFGLVDAAAAVELAKTWQALPPRQKISYSQQVERAIPNHDGSSLKDSILVSGSGIESIEWVDVVFHSNHDYAGDLDITLTSPAGTESWLAERHLCDTVKQGDQLIPLCTAAITKDDGSWRWRFGSARHLGETADGQWTLEVHDSASREKLPGTGSWLSWKLILHGHEGGL